MCFLKVGPAIYLKRPAAQKNKILPQVVVVVSFNGTWSARVICKRIEYLISLILFIFFSPKSLGAICIWIFAYLSKCLVGFFPKPNRKCLHLSLIDLKKLVEDLTERWGGGGLQQRVDGRGGRGSRI